MRMLINRTVGAGLVLGLLACLLSWLLMTDTSSPLQEYLLHNPALRNVWGNATFPVLAAMIVLGLPESDYVLFPLVFLQWFVIGCSVAFVAKRIRRA